MKTPEKLFEIYLTSVGRGSTLLLNVPPDRRGHIHEKDVQALMDWRKIINKELGTNLAAGAKAEASAVRGNSKTYSAAMAADGDQETYWCTDDDVTTGSVEIDLGKMQTVKYILLQEYIKLGQRVKEFNVEVWKDNAWKKVAAATTIGYKRILKPGPVVTDKIRINITASRACPLLSNVEVY